MPRGYTQPRQIKDREHVRPPLPTEAPPGSPEKVAVLAQRALRGEALYSPSDATGEQRYTCAAYTEANGRLVRTGVQEDRKGIPLAPHAFGLRLTALRTERGWSRKRLARCAAITLRYVTLLERGSCQPSLAVATALADALQLSLDRLVGRPPPREM